MSTYEIITENADETMNIANKLAQSLHPGDVLTLEGELGAGKTTFTKGLANGLGVKKNVNSPTFTIIKEYQGHIPLYHMDVYRLGESGEDMGLEEYFYGDGITVIEWAQYIEDQLPKARLNIEILRKGEQSRKIIFSPTSEYFEFICKEII